jgi:predicted MPP superfamily phosphohydrolase
LLLGAAFLAYMFAEARRMPVMRVATLDLPDYPAGVAPLRVALLTDTHMAGPDESPERLERIVAALNAQRPDLVLLGGDYIGEPKAFGRSYSRATTVAAFARLKARLGWSRSSAIMIIGTTQVR